MTLTGTQKRPSPHRGEEGGRESDAPTHRAMPATGNFFVSLSAQAAELHDDVLPEHACILLRV